MSKRRTFKRALVDFEDVHSLENFEKAWSAANAIDDICTRHKAIMAITSEALGILTDPRHSNALTTIRDAVSPLH